MARRKGKGIGGKQRNGRKHRINSKKRTRIYSDFAYDDAFRTIESECDDVLIPFVNYFHNENYGDGAHIIRGRNEHFIEHPDHSVDKRITDSSFKIEENGRSRNYHYECESKSYQDSLLVRMFEYDSQIALDMSELDTGCLRVTFPYSGILILRGKPKLNEAFIEMITPGGTVRYPIKIRYMSELDLDMIFEKHLYMLLPFYIFNLETWLNKIVDDQEELESFSEILRDIMARLEDEVEKRHLSSFSYSVIISLIDKVAYKITMKNKNVQKRVGEIMGGKVMDLEVIRAHRQGKAEGFVLGEAHGEVNGRAKEKEENIKKLAASYMNNDQSLTDEEAMKMARAILE